MLIEEIILITNNETLYKDIDSVLGSNKNLKLISPETFCQNKVNTANDNKISLYIIDIDSLTEPIDNIIDKIKKLNRLFDIITLVKDSDYNKGIESLKQGVFAYIRKSTLLNEIDAIVERALERIRLISKNESLSKEIIETNEIYTKERQRLLKEINSLTTFYEVAETIITPSLLDDLFTIILRKVIYLFNVDIVKICVVDDEKKELFQLAELNFLDDKFLKETLSKAMQNTFDKRESIIFKNKSNEGYYPDGRTEIASGVCIPLISRGKIFGVIGVGTLKNKTFEEDEIRSLSLIAHQTAISIENSRLHEKIEDKTKELFALNQISGFLISDIKLKDLLSEIVSRARDLLSAEAGSLLLIDTNTNELVFEVVQDEKSQGLEGTRIKIGTGISGWVAEQGKPLRISEVYKDERFYAGIDKVTKFKSKSMLCVPLKLKDKIIGVIDLMNKKGARSFTEHDQEILLSIANQAAITIENARLRESANFRINKLGKEIKDLYKLYDFTREIGFLTDTSHLLELFRKSIQDIMDFSVFLIFILKEPDGGIIEFELKEPLSEEQIFKLEQNLFRNWERMGDRILDVDKFERRINIMPRNNNQNNIQGQNGKNISSKTQEFKSHILAPLVAEGKVFGMLSIYSFYENAYSQDDLWIFFTGAGLIAMSLRNKELLEQLEVKYKEAEEKNQKLKEMQNKLIESEKSAVIGQMAATVNHEVNNPLCSIVLDTELLKLHLKDDEVSLKRLKSIEESCERIKTVTQKLTQITHPKITSYAGLTSMIDINKSIKE